MCGDIDAATGAETIGRRNRAAEKPRPAARKDRAKRFAFGLPQDLHMQLMFEPCAERGSRLSAFRGAGFHVERRAAGSAPRLVMSRKGLNARPNSDADTMISRAIPLRASIDTVFHSERRAAKPRKAAACHQFAA